LSGGARHSTVRYDSRDYYIVGPNPDDSGRTQFSRTTPVAGLMFKATPNWHAYANYGAGFESPTFAELAYRPGGATGINFGLQPATSQHVELGVKALLGSKAKFNAAVFHIDTKNEIVTNSSSGGRSDFRNASDTRRDGAEVSIEAILPAGFESYAACTWLNARFTAAYTAGTPPVTVPAGNRLPGVPRAVLYAELVWRHAASGFHAAVEYRASSKVYVNEANSDAAAGFGSANLRIGFQQQYGRTNAGGWKFSEYVRVDNVTDQRYLGSVIVAEARGRFFEPAPGRNWDVGVSVAHAF
jgi:iron complex outermembrane receptor protein